MIDGLGVQITGVDIGPSDLAEQLPVRVLMLGVRPGDDRSDYVVAVAREPIRFHTTPQALAEAGVAALQTDPELVSQNQTDASLDLLIYGLVMASRVEGTTINDNMKDFPVSLAYIMDNTQMADDRIDFSKLFYAAVAFVSMDNAG